jgi:UDP-N-acetylglucosamine transferase subunit ALG13
MLGRGAVIFASVGSMLPFDRLVRAVDEWARDNPAERVFIQIGGGDYLPRHAAYARMISMADYRERLAACDLFVAHVGMGSILQALEAGTPMLLLPRRHALGEHTTDHQLHTAARLGGRSGIGIAADGPALHRAMSRRIAPAGERIGSIASLPLLAGVRGFLQTTLAN